MRRMVRETHLRVDDLVAPLFVMEGCCTRQPVPSMPDVERLTVDELLREVEALVALGIPAVALFPLIPEEKKDAVASEALNPEGLYPRAIQRLKETFPELVVISDVALDPYSSLGHDGIVRDGEVVNDETLEVLANMAVLHAQAGADVVAPSDMMDGRVAALRQALDEAGFSQVAILAYSAKYASALYGPFRDALESAPRELEGVPADKKTYQMDPANAREALREVMLDLEEGADIVMVKPAHAYLDVIYRVREAVDVPVAAYHVSGEYAMIMAAARQGWLDERTAALEVLTAIRRAGADIIFTYFARKAAQWLNA